MLQKSHRSTFKRQAPSDDAEPGAAAIVVPRPKMAAPDGAKDYAKAKKVEEEKTIRLRAMRLARDAQGPTVNRTAPSHGRDDQAQ